MKHKKSLTSILILVMVILFMGMKNNIKIKVNYNNPYKVVAKYNKRQKQIEEWFTYVYVDEEQKFYDFVREGIMESLFEKFEVKYEFRSYIKQLCKIYNIPIELGLSIAQIETHNGRVKDYNVRADYRMYYTWDRKTNSYVKTWDLGYFQMNDFYEDYWEECFFNPELIFSLGYIRNEFDITDDIINIQIGIAYIDYLLKYYYGDETKATMAFNTGMGNVNKGKIPDRTIAYEHAVRNNWKYIEKDIL